MWLEIFILFFIYESEESGLVLYSVLICLPMAASTFTMGFKKLIHYWYWAFLCYFISLGLFIMDAALSFTWFVAWSYSQRQFEAFNIMGTLNILCSIGVVLHGVLAYRAK
ncbi:hypothetical protein Anas_02622 [Armadillidium nasatum]|uniref:Uncharacterized protein n=1 Tax=Armadillidium nasatum TaxID=96803 RepID=A0A5N5TJ02_9CRUS|nr:hypothetical protein Anas_02622 [Armadillidium nasatum]